MTFFHKIVVAEKKLFKCITQLCKGKSNFQWKIDKPWKNQIGKVPAPPSLVGKLPKNCLSVFDNFVGLTLEGLFFWISRLLFPITLHFRYDFIKLLITFFLLYFIFLEKSLQHVTQKADDLNSRQQITVLRFCNNSFLTLETCCCGYLDISFQG